MRVEKTNKMKILKVKIQNLEIEKMIEAIRAKEKTYQAECA